MIRIMPAADSRQASLPYNLFHFAARLLPPKLMSRMLRLLLGISIAAINGDRVPCTAKYKPIILYRIDRTKLAITIRLFVLHN